jgi:hypothetical protein
MPKGICNNTGRTRFQKGMAPWNKGKRFVKNAMIISVFMALTLITGCNSLKQPTKIVEITHWTGDKESIKKYLDSPYALADRYIVEALR